MLIILSKSDDHVSPFMSLPSEIRNMIYKFVLGGNFVHLSRRKHETSVRTRNHETSLNHRVCLASLSEEEAQRLCQTADPSSWSVEGVASRRKVCYSKNKYKSIGLNISLLYVCRRIYTEARFMAYSSNTFSFAEPATVRAFIAKNMVYSSRYTQPTNFNLALRNIHLDLGCCRSSLPGLKKVLDIVISDMTKLERVSINIKQPGCWGGMNNQVQIDAMQFIFDSFAKLKELHLKSATVVVGDTMAESLCKQISDPHTNTALQKHWTAGERRDWAETLEQAILSRE